MRKDPQAAKAGHVAAPGEHQADLLFRPPSSMTKWRMTAYLFSEKSVVHLTQPSTANGWWKILEANPRGCFNPHGGAGLMAWPTKRLGKFMLHSPVLLATPPGVGPCQM